MTLRIDRLLGIILLLLNNKSLSGKQLSERFGVSIRTIQRDITTLCMAGIPIVSNSGSKGGYSILDSYKLENDFIKKEDFSIIIMALKSLSTSYENNRLNQILDKYLSVSKNNNPLVFLDYGVTKEGHTIQEKNKLLEQCIGEKTQVTFDYKNAYGEKSMRIVNPLLLHFKWYSWYLLSFDNERQDYRTFKVVRMDNVLPTKHTFQCVQNVYEILREQEQDYYKNCEHIIVSCSSGNIDLLEENFPDADFIQQKDGSWIMDLYVPPAEKMWQSLLIGLGDSIKIIEPAYYRKRLINIAKKFIANCDR